MNDTENNIVTKITTEIGTATTEERSVLIGDLYTFLGTVEKRIALSTGSFAARCMAEVKGIAAEVKTGAGKIGEEIKTLV